MLSSYMRMPICNRFSSMHPILLACDASAYEIGAVLSHKFVNASEANWFCVIQEH